MRWTTMYVTILLACIVLHIGDANYATVPLSRSSSKPARWVIENKVLKVTIDASRGAFTVVDKRIGYVWRTFERAIGKVQGVTIPKCERMPKIDGDLSDWRTCARLTLTPDMVADARKVDDARDCSATAMLMWSDDALYIAMRVRDEMFQPAGLNAARWWEGDSVEFWIGGEQYAVRTDGRDCNVYWHGRGRIIDADAAIRKLADGYAIEVRMPLKSMAVVSNFKLGMQFRFAIGVNDADAKVQRECQLYFPKTWRHSDTETFAIATLCDSQWRSPKVKRQIAVFRDVRKIPSNPPRISLTTDAKMVRGGTFPIRATMWLEGADLVIELDVRDREMNVTRFTALHPLIMPDANALIVTAPYCNGIAIPVTDMSWRRQHWSTYGRLDMPWVGVTDGTKGYMLLWEDPDDGMCVFDAFATPIGKVLAPIAFHEPCMRKFSYARRIRYCFVHKGGYVAICKRYRAYAKAHGLLVTLREKMKRKPALKYLAGAPDVWGADGVGGIKFCREAKALGIDRMIVNGDWSPQIAREMMSLGYLVSRYDNYEDIIEGGRPPYGDCKIPDDAPLRADGKRQLGWLTWDKKRQFYKRCSLLQLPVARRFIPNHLRKFPHNAWFIDVTTATWLIECYDSKHRHTRTRDRKAKRALAKFVSDELGLVLGGEHGRWWGVDIYDYWEGMMSGGFYSWPAGHVGVNLPKRREEIGKRYIEWGIGHKHRLPLWELTFGDCVVSTWYWGDSTGHLYRAAPEIAAKKDAFNILYATVPLYWVNRAFGFNWSDPKLRERLLESYRITCKLHEQIGFEEMLTHEYVTPDKDVQRTVFESGTEVIVNFGKKPFALVRDGRKFTLPQFGFYAHGPKVFQYRALAGDRSITFIQTPTYAFCDANGKVHDFGICVTDGQVTMRVEGTERIRINLSSVTADVLLRPQRLVRAFDMRTARLISLTDDGVPIDAQRIERRGDAILIRTRTLPKALMLIWGSAVGLPDIAVSADAIKLSPRTPRQGQDFSLTVVVKNNGGASAVARIAVYLDDVAPQRLLAQRNVRIKADGKVRTSFTIRTDAIDGEHDFVIEATALKPRRELVQLNNIARVGVNIRSDYQRWRYKFDAVVDARGIRRLDEPIIVPIDFSRVAGVPAGVCVSPNSVRALVLTDDGTIARTLPVQFEPEGGAGNSGTLVIMLKGEMPPDAKLRLRIVADPIGTAHAPMRNECRWNEREQTVTTPCYQIRFVDGVIREWLSFLPNAPKRSFLRSLGVSSRETGWVDEIGEVERVDVIREGATRIIVRIIKNLRGGYRVTKTYEFYRRHFVVECEANRGGLLFSRAYYTMPCRFEDDMGNRAIIDGRGEGEGVIGKNPQPKWYAVYAENWAHSCIALSRFTGLVYWDAGAWGGVAFSTPDIRNVRIAYVIHEGQKNPSFAVWDYKRLINPLKMEIITR